MTWALLIVLYGTFGSVATTSIQGFDTHELCTQAAEHVQRSIEKRQIDVFCVGVQSFEVN